MDYPELPPHQANFCTLCRLELSENEKYEYRAEKMPPMCEKHLAEILPKRAKCLELFSKMNIG